MPAPSPGAPTLYDFYLDPSLEAWTTSEDDDDDSFEWQTYLNRRSSGREWFELLSPHELK